MATEHFYFQGKAKWAKLGLGDDPTFNSDQEYECWKVNVYLDDPSWESFRKSGLRLEPKEDDDGKYVTFRRPFRKLIKNEIVEFEKPPVLVADKETGKNNVMNGLLGNGSDVIVKVAVYDSRKGKAHRLEAVQVQTLVEYNKAAEQGGKLVVGGQEIVPF